MSEPIPCAMVGCTSPANALNREAVQTSTMPAPAFYYYCDQHDYVRVREQAAKQRAIQLARAATTAGKDGER